MLRVFLDANVLFSASNAGSNIARLIDLLIRNGQAVTSEFAIEEARRNGQLKRPDWASDLKALIKKVECVHSVKFDLPVQISDKDAPILCTAIRSGCQYLATGDKQHFGHLYGQTVGGISIIPLTKLAELLRR